MSPSQRQSRKDVVDQMLQLVPQFVALGLVLEDFGDERAVFRLPYRKELVAYQDTGVLAGGAIYTLMDSVCGAAVLAALAEMRPTATLDLRLDYLKPAHPGEDVRGAAHCYKVTRHIAFVRGTAYHERADDPIAHATGTFMLRAPEAREETPQ